MDDPVPTIDFSPSGFVENQYGLGRTDVEGARREGLTSVIAS
jgi:hypothetical protein